MNHNVHVPGHVSGLLARAVWNAMERITDPEVAPVMGECIETTLVEPPNGARLRVRLIRWK